MPDVPVIRFPKSHHTVYLSRDLKFPVFGRAAAAGGAVTCTVTSSLEKMGTPLTVKVIRQPGKAGEDADHKKNWTAVVRFANPPKLGEKFTITATAGTTPSEPVIDITTVPRTGLMPMDKGVVTIDIPTDMGTESYNELLCEVHLSAPAAAPKANGIVLSADGGTTKVGVASSDPEVQGQQPWWISFDDVANPMTMPVPYVLTITDNYNVSGTRNFKVTS